MKVKLKWPTSVGFVHVSQPVSRTAAALANSGNVTSVAQTIVHGKACALGSITVWVMSRSTGVPFVTRNASQT